MRPSLSRRSRRFSSLLMASALVVGLVQTTTAADRTSGFKLAANQPTKVGKTIKVDVSKAAQTKDGRIAIIVKLEDASVASYTGGVNGFKATNPATLGNKTIKLKATGTARYRSYINVKQDAFIKRVDSNVKRAKVTGQTDLVLNAVSLIVPADSVAAIAKMPGVAAIYPDVVLHPQTDVSPEFIGADTIWGDLGGQESAGEGVIVGVLDTGIWPEHPSFADPDPSGKAYDAPPDPPTGTRACEFGSATPGDEEFECNNKLIGAQRVMDTNDIVRGLDDDEFDSARDDDGHGTHTSSTSAGDSGVEASIYGVERGIISGVAPRAWVEMFKVCGTGGCYSSDTAAATQAAIEDGVNVINFSISGGGNPYSDATELAFLDAYNAGVFVAASAGNAGPGADTTDHRGGWVTTVAASTAPRAFVDTIHLTADGGATLDLAGTSLTAGVGPAPLVIAGDPLCGPGGDYTDTIVLCERGDYGRAEKGFNVSTAGAVGMILYNQSTGVTDVETDNHWLPASHIQFTQGQQILDFLDAHTGVMATISDGVTGTQQSDVMASFSSRGGPGQRLGISKPDITAPGVQILAGAAPIHVDDPALGPEGELFQAIAGTSMSSPHIAGSGALLKALHPNWTPGQIKSAIMTTAQTAGLVKEDGTTPFNAFDAGSGRVNLDVAGDPGLTFDVTGNDYLLFEDELYRANYPSIYHPSLPGIITLTRVARSVLTNKSDWKLTTSGPSDLQITVPSTLSVLPGADQSFTIKIDASRVPIGETRFASIKLTQTDGGNRVLHMPVTIVRGQADVTLTKECDPTKVKKNDKTTCTITVTNPTFDEVSYNVKDKLPKKLELKQSSVHGASEVKKRKVIAHGTLGAADPADVGAEICDGCSPAGYLPLGDFDIPDIGGTDDESIANYDVPDFEYAGETWSQIGFVSNGYAVVGGGTGADVEYINQIFPDAAPPNNVLAPFWTDLNPADGGAMRIATLQDDVTFETWLILEWDDVPEYTGGGSEHMQIWIGLNGVEDITYTYGDMGSGDGGYATTGAENRYGNRGANVYADGTGVIPEAGTEILVSSTPGSMESHVITFKAKNVKSGDWTNCAKLRSDAFLGTSYACESGHNK
jgi:subtilisin family serine protease